MFERTESVTQRISDLHPVSPDGWTMLAYIQLRVSDSFCVKVWLCAVFCTRHGNIPVGRLLFVTI